MKLNYQKIEGVYDNAIDRMPEYKQIFPDTAKGLSILDLGCYIGFYLLQAKKQDAGRCVGVEMVQAFHAEAVRLAKHFDLDIDYFNMDVMNWCTEEVFDVTLCLSLLHHLTIDKVNKLINYISAHTRKRSVFIIIPPSTRSLWAIENSPTAGTPKVRLTPDYLYSKIQKPMTVSQSITMPERFVVEFHHNNGKEKFR